MNTASPVNRAGPADGPAGVVSHGGTALQRAGFPAYDERPGC